MIKQCIGLCLRRQFDMFAKFPTVTVTFMSVCPSHCME